MKFINGHYYVQVKDKRYRIHSTENIILRERDQPKFLRTQYPVQNETQIRKNQKVIKIEIIELEVKNYPKNKQPIVQKHKFEPENCSSSKQKKLATI